MGFQFDALTVTGSLSCRRESERGRWNWLSNTVFMIGNGMDIGGRVNSRNHGNGITRNFGVEGYHAFTYNSVLIKSI